MVVFEVFLISFNNLPLFCQQQASWTLERKTSHCLANSCRACPSFLSEDISRLAPSLSSSFGRKKRRWSPGRWCINSIGRVHPAGLCSWDPGQHLGLCLLCITLPKPMAHCWPRSEAGGLPQHACQPRGPGEQYLAVSGANLHFIWSRQPTLMSGSALHLTFFQDARFWRLQRGRKSANFSKEENI